MVVISFVNMKGGVGKTTLAVNIADFLTKRHSKKVLLVDVDPQFNATQCLLNGDDYVEYLKNGGTTIVDIFNYKKSATISVVDAPTVQEPVPYENIHPYSTKRRFDLIPSQLDLFRFEMAPGQGTEHRLKNYLNHIKECGEYDICIIDCPPTPSVWMTSALIASDYYLIPSKPDPISMTGLDLLEGIIKERKDNYATLCRTVHGDPTVMHPISALQFLPRYEEILLKELSVLYIRVVESMLGVLYLNYPAVIDMMHPQNHEDFLVCMAKSTKKEIIKELFD